MARWTNGRFAFTPRLKINRSGAERYAVAHFAIPEFAAAVARLPSCMRPGNPPKYPPLRVGAFILGRMRRTGTRNLRHG